jgi:hypothetical protein
MEQSAVLECVPLISLKLQLHLQGRVSILTPIHVLAVLRISVAIAIWLYA